MGDPASHTLYNMARQATNLDANDYVWLAVVGATYRYVCMEDMERATYLKLVGEYRDSVLALNGPARAASPSSSSAANASSSSNDSSRSEGVRLEFIENELRLMHYRHWSLVEAFAHTDHAAARLGAWDASQQNGPLNQLLAQLGVPLRVAQEKYAFMSGALRANLTPSLLAASETFKLDDLTFPSFVKREGFEPVFSASDYAYALAALLDGTAVGVGLASAQAQGGGASSPLAPGRTTTTNASSSVHITTNEATCQARFQHAYRALASEGAEAKALVLRGVELSKEIHGIIVNRGVSAMGSRAVMSAGDFRHVTIDAGQLEGPGGLAQTLFARPAGAVRLANFLLRAHRAKGKWRGSSGLPLIVAIKSDTKRAIVAGIPCPETRGTVLKNGFAPQFRQAARRVVGKSDAVEEFADGSVVELDAESVRGFLHALGDVMSGGGGS